MDEYISSLAEKSREYNTTLNLAYGYYPLPISAVNRFYLLRYSKRTEEFKHTSFGLANA